MSSDPRSCRITRILWSAVAVMLSMTMTAPSLLFAGQEQAPCPPPPVVPTTKEVLTLLNTAQDRGFLWKIEKGGRTGYLYGSIHIGKREWMVPGPKTIAALQNSDLIALELNIFDPQVNTDLSNPSRFGITMIELPDPLKQRIDSRAKPVCASIEALATMHPLMQIMTLSIYEARFYDLEPDYGTEILVFGFATATRKPVASLETAQIQLRALLAGTEKTILDMIDHGLILIESGNQQAQTERLIQDWATGNLEDLQQYEQWCKCMDRESDRIYFKGLLDDRNPGLASGIDKFVRSGKTIFAAVGALHMTGPKSVTVLLEQMGYKVERVRFKD